MAAGVDTHRGDLRRVPPLTATSAANGVIGRFREVLAAQPTATAVTDHRRELTFALVALEAAGILAQLRDTMHPSAGTPAEPVAIAAAGSGPGLTPVALVHSHDAGAVCALLAVIASGHPVLVLDPRTPTPRLKDLVGRVGVQFCVADTDCADVAAQLVPTVIRTPPAPPAPTTGPRVPLGVEVLWASPPDPATAAVLAFTSGSTGRPKVVANDHRMLVRDAWVNSAATGCYDACDTIAHTLPMAFHAGLMATIAGLLTGCTMKLYDVRGAGIGGLAGWLERERATVMQASPAILRAFTGTGPTPAQLRGLRSLTIAGEAAYGRDIEAIGALLPAECAIRNRYGSSETGLIAEFPLASAQSLTSGALPAGRPVGDTELALVDESGRPVAAGQEGIVTVTAPSLALGYWGDPEATAAAFTDHPDGTRTFRTSDVGRFGVDGRLHLLGRRDHSVKIRGQLVEPGDVDAALFALPDVREAVVVGAPRPADGGTRLVAYVVPATERPSAVALRTALHRRLPGYMVPEAMVFLDALPRTDRGKLDRAALPPAPTVVPGARADDLTEWERVVGGVWEQVLSLDLVGPDDDFFELGGDSLAAEQLMAAIRELGVPQSQARTGLLAEAPTLSAFAGRLRRAPARGQNTLIPLQTEGDRIPLFLVAGAGGLGVGMLPLTKHLGADQPIYALQAYALERPGMPDWSVRAAARRHVRTLRSIQPEGPYRVGGHSFGALVALEIGHQLRAAGQEVDLLIILDSFPPDPRSQPTPQPRPFGRRVRDLFGLLATGLVPTPGIGQHWRFHRQSMLLTRFYRCAPWPGRTLVVVADSPERELRAAWAPHLSGPWRSIQVAGDHVAIMREPYAGQIAAALLDELCALDQSAEPDLSRT